MIRINFHTFGERGFRTHEHCLETLESTSNVRFLRCPLSFDVLRGTMHEELRPTKMTYLYPVLLNSLEDDQILSDCHKVVLTVF